MISMYKDQAECQLKDECRISDILYSLPRQSSTGDKYSVH